MIADLPWCGAVFCTFNAYFALIPEELNRAIQRTFNANAESREDAKPPRHFYTLLSVTYTLIKGILVESIRKSKSDLGYTHKRKV